MVNGRRGTGFTLVEMIITITILGVVSAVLAVFIQRPVEGYFDSVRRAELVDVADTALRRLGRDLRRAVPNSVRVAGACGGANCYLEFLPTTSGGRYRAAGEGTNHCAAATTTLFDSLAFSSDVDTCFEILGPPLAFAAGDQIVIGNWGNAGSSAYEGNTTAGHVRRAYAGAAGAGLQSVVLASANPLPLESPSRRFQVISAAEQAVTYACEGVGITGGDGTGTLTRYWGYGIEPAQPDAAAEFDGSSALIAENLSACNIVYGSLAVSNPYTRNGLVQIVVAITRDDETINLYHEIHVDNLP